MVAGLFSHPKRQFFPPKIIGIHFTFITKIPGDTLLTKMSAELPSTEQIFTETSRLVPLSKFHAKKINVSILYAKMLHNFAYLFDNTLNFKFIDTYILRGIYFQNDVDRYDNIIQLSNNLFQRIHNSIYRFPWL